MEQFRSGDTRTNLAEFWTINKVLAQGLSEPEKEYINHKNTPFPSILTSYIKLMCFTLAFKNFRFKKSIGGLQTHNRKKIKLLVDS